LWGGLLTCAPIGKIGTDGRIADPPQAASLPYRAIL